MSSLSRLIYYFFIDSLIKTSLFLARCDDQYSVAVHERSSWRPHFAVHLSVDGDSAVCCLRASRHRRQVRRRLRHSGCARVGEEGLGQDRMEVETSAEERTTSRSQKMVRTQKIVHFSLARRRYGGLNDVLIDWLIDWWNDWMINHQSFPPMITSWKVDWL